MIVSAAAQLLGRAVGTLTERVERSDRERGEKGGRGARGGGRVWGTGRCNDESPAITPETVTDKNGNELLVFNEQAKSRFD